MLMARSLSVGSISRNRIVNVTFQTLMLNCIFCTPMGLPGGLALSGAQTPGGLPGHGHLF